MDLPKAPDHNDLKAAGGVWNVIVFFCGLVFSGGLIEYWISSRYVTKKELAIMQTNCTQHIQDQLQIALMKRDEALEEKIVRTISTSIKEGFDGLKREQ